MADVMGCPVVRIQVSKGAALGAALMAAYGWLAEADEKPDWEEVVSVFTDPIAKSEIKPNKKATRVYEKMLKAYAGFEQETLREIAGPRRR
jgi:sugar (pentulose or hexulose) kinase